MQKIKSSRKSVSPNKNSVHHAGKVINLHSKEKENISLKSLSENINDLKKEETLYEKQIEKNPLDKHAYNRLMIIYRKQKKYKEELTLINKGIKYFKEHYAKRLEKKAGNTKVVQLSNGLMKHLGLADKKGNLLIEPEPINKWEKRKKTVEKRLK